MEAPGAQMRPCPLWGHPWPPCLVTRQAPQGWARPWKLGQRSEALPAGGGRETGGTTQVWARGGTHEVAFWRRGGEQPGGAFRPGRPGSHKVGLAQPTEVSGVHLAVLQVGKPGRAWPPSPQPHSILSRVMDLTCWVGLGSWRWPRGARWPGGAGLRGRRDTCHVPARLWPWQPGQGAAG